VELVTTEHGRAVPDQCVLCDRVPGHLRPPVHHRVGMAA
jgi:hypothetical protein